MSILLRVLINALTLLLLPYIITGFEIDSFYAAIIAAIVIGLLNAIVRPVLLIFTLPISLLTLGLFAFVINALLIWFAASFLDGFTISGFWAAFFAAVILWSVGVLTNWFIKGNK